MTAPRSALSQQGVLLVCASREAIRVDKGLARSAFSRIVFFFFSSRRRHTRLQGDWSSDVCSSDLQTSLTQRKTSRCLRWQGLTFNVSLSGKPYLEARLRHLDTAGASRRVSVCVVERSEERRVGKEGRSRWSPYH